MVFIAYDMKTNKEYALKVTRSKIFSFLEKISFVFFSFKFQRLFAADDSAKKAIAQEIAFLVSFCFLDL